MVEREGGQQSKKRKATAGRKEGGKGHSRTITDKMPLAASSSSWSTGHRREPGAMRSSN
jgi:hypothetical protein